jgi:hypothetical protein
MTDGELLGGRGRPRLEPSIVSDIDATVDGGIVTCGDVGFYAEKQALSRWCSASMASEAADLLAARA